MLKKSIVLSLCMLPLGAAYAANAVKCSPPVVQVTENAKTAFYTVKCDAVAGVTLLPKIEFSGEVFTGSTPPYDVSANYTLDVRPLLARVPGEDVRSDQVAAGSFKSSTVSVAALPTQFASQVSWDSSSGTLSIEEEPSRWRVFSLQLAEGSDSRMTSAGYASEPMKEGRTRTKLVLGSRYSRFAGKAEVTPVVHVEQGLRDGKLEVLLAETTVASQSDLQDAMLLLDKKPKDMTRAWGLAARAKFVGNENLVRYAEQKVAAHNPQLLEEFQLSLQRVKPFTLEK